MHSERPRDEEKSGYVPYRQGVINVTTFLRRLDARQIHSLTLIFDVNEIAKSESDFLTYLKDIRNEFEDIVLKGHFPSLHTIMVDVGATKDAIPIWASRFGECFPMITQRNMLRVIEHIVSR